MAMVKVAEHYNELVWHVRDGDLPHVKRANLLLSMTSQ